MLNTEKFSFSFSMVNIFKEKYLHRAERYRITKQMEFNYADLYLTWFFPFCLPHPLLADCSVNIFSAGP